MSDACPCFVDVIEEARSNAIAQALAIIEDAANLGMDDDAPDRIVVLGGALSMLHLAIDSHFPPEEAKVLTPHITSLLTILTQLRAMDGAHRSEQPT